MEPPDTTLSPESLVAEVTRQPRARLRSAIIALLLVRPDYWRAVQALQPRSVGSDKCTLRLFYTAAVLLQRLQAPAIKARLGTAWEPLPVLFFHETEGDQGAPLGDRLCRLAEMHQQLTGIDLNREGTYRGAAHHVLRQWELEARWSQ